MNEEASNKCQVLEEGLVLSKNFSKGRFAKPRTLETTIENTSSVLVNFKNSREHRVIERQLRRRNVSAFVSEESGDAIYLGETIYCGGPFFFENATEQKRLVIRVRESCSIEESTINF